MVPSGVRLCSWREWRRTKYRILRHTPATLITSTEPSDDVRMFGDLQHDSYRTFAALQNEDQGERSTMLKRVQVCAWMEHVRRIYPRVARWFYPDYQHVSRAFMDDNADLLYGLRNLNDTAGENPFGLPVWA